MNIVVIVPGGISDTLQAAPLARAIAAVTDTPPLLMCAPDGLDLVRTFPGMSEVVALPRLGGGGRPGQLWGALRNRRLDVALVCSERFGIRSAVYAASVPRRVGSRDGISDLLLTDVLPASPSHNRQRRWMALAEPLTGSAAPLEAPSWRPPQPAADIAERLLLERGLGDGRLLVAIGPGLGWSGAGGEVWRGERFAHLGNRLAARHGAGIVLVGDQRDRDVAQSMRVDLAAETVDLCGEIDLLTTAAVVARCDLLVAVDTPLLQVAAAVGTPSVGLFARRDGRRVAAAGPGHRVVQSLARGGLPALADIRVDDVLAAIEGAS